jgi:hypothetical protein
VSCFFSKETNQRAVVRCFVALQRAVLHFDADKSHRLSREELDNLFRESFPDFFSGGMYRAVLEEMFPDRVMISIHFRARDIRPREQERNDVSWGESWLKYLNSQTFARTVAAMAFDGSVMLASITR